MRSSSLFLLYLALGALVAGGVIGDDHSLFSGLSTIEELVELILTVLLWPLVLLGIDIHIGDINIGGADSSQGEPGGADGRRSGRGGDGFIIE